MTSPMPTEPHHRRISRELRAEIAAGSYPPHARLPSETQLVERYGVSRPTVARALRDLQEQGLIERRGGSGTFLRPASSLPESPHAGNLRQFGLLIPGLGATDIFDPICAELATLARVRESTLLWGDGTRPQGSATARVAQADALCEQFVRRRIDGVFFAPFEHLEDRERINRRLVERLREAGIAVILLDRDLAPFPARSDFDLVGIDNFVGGYLPAEHLLKLGCLRPAFLAPPRSAPTVDLRCAGAREAIRATGRPVPPEFVVDGAPDDPETVRKLRAEGVDGVLCSNDRTAALLLQTLARAGLKVPRDMRVIGFDDASFAPLLSVPLTTVRQPCRDLAAVAFRAMWDRVLDPGLPSRQHLLPVQLVVRESCGTYLPRPG